MAVSGKNVPLKPYRHGDQGTCTCPHCWAVFPLEDALYIAMHPELLGDPVLGPDANQRFRPTSFTPEGQAVDPGGYTSSRMACPRCHEEVPRSLTDFKTVFFSIVGDVRSGKSYFLAVLLHKLGPMLSSFFALNFGDPETELNLVLHDYEKTLFFTKDPTVPVAIQKTQETGDLYKPVTLDGVQTILPKPFIFTIKPKAHHPDYATPEQVSRALILYDNAGEHFQPGKDTVLRPGTQHMAKSRCLFFVYDPTQDPRFRELLKGHPDPQLDPKRDIQQQHLIFNEAARRIRQHLGLSPTKKCQKDVIVLVSKMDVWESLLSFKINAEPLVPTELVTFYGLDIDLIRDVSYNVRRLLHRVCPEVVNAVEDFSDKVMYIPCSSLGCSPILNPSNPNDLMVRPTDIKPRWVTVPFLYAMAKLGLIYTGRRPQPADLRPAELIQSDQVSLICRFEDPTPLILPLAYAGQMVHHPVTGKPFLVPKPG